MEDDCNKAGLPETMAVSSPADCHFLSSKPDSAHHLCSSTEPSAVTSSLEKAHQVLTLNKSPAKPAGTGRGLKTTLRTEIRPPASVPRGWLTANGPVPHGTPMRQGGLLSAEACWTAGPGLAC